MGTLTGNISIRVSLNVLANHLLTIFVDQEETILGMCGDMECIGIYHKQQIVYVIIVPLQGGQEKHRGLVISHKFMSCVQVMSECVSE